MPNNPHDLLFKRIFSETENAVAHFQRSLPPAIASTLDMTRAAHVPGSWVDEALQSHHSDLLFSIPLRGQETGDADGLLLYVLWEHQSTVRKFVAFKLQRYLTRMLDAWCREHPGKLMPPVLPLVLYHGDAKWTAPTELEDLFELGGMKEAAREELRSYLPKLRYLLQEVPSDPDEIDAAPGIVRLTLRVLRLGRGPKILMQISTWEEDFQVESAKGKDGLQRLELVLHYILVVNDEVTPESLSEALEPMGTEVQELVIPENRIAA